MPSRTAEPAVTRFLGHWTAAHGVPLISVTATVGYGHDLALVAHQATRLAVHTLLHSPHQGLADDYWVADVPVDGGPAHWQARPLRIHPDCPLPHPTPAVDQLSLWVNAAPSR